MVGPSGWRGALFEAAIKKTKPGYAALNRRRPAGGGLFRQFHWSPYANLGTSGMNRIKTLQTAFDILGVEQIALNKVAARMKIPPEFYPWFERNRKKIGAAVKKSHKTHETISIVEPIIFKNPYGFHPAGKESNDKNQKIKISCQYLYQETFGGFFDYQNQTIIINSFFYDKEEVEEAIKYLLLHEITHAIDPKGNQGDELYERFVAKWKKQGLGELGNFNNDMEFDAYSTEVIEILLDRADEYDIIDFLRREDSPYTRGRELPYFDPDSIWEMLNGAVSTFSDKQFRKLKTNIYLALQTRQR